MHHHDHQTATTTTTTIITHYNHHHYHHSRVPLQLTPGPVALEEPVVVHVLLANTAPHPVVRPLAVGAVPPLRRGNL